MRIPLALALATATVCLPARAGKPFCADLAGLREKVDACEKNGQYLEAATDCLRKLDADIAARKTALGLRFIAADADSASSQRARFANSAGDLQEATRAFSALLDEAELALKEIRAYDQHLEWPGGKPSAELVEGLKLDEFLPRMPCFQNNRKGLARELVKLGRKISDLKKAASATGALEARQSGKMEALKAAEAGIRQAKGRERGAQPQGKPQGKPSAPSDISGLPEDSAKTKGP